MTLGCPICREDLIFGCDVDRSETVIVRSQSPPRRRHGPQAARPVRTARHRPHLHQERERAVRSRSVPEYRAFPSRPGRVIFLPSPRGPG
ncbi:hypothetical protein GCM10010336_15330 [Streptomyces goshikiensis]|nr:hypothetical protein GCM10010336_15330 [Streptomyces goshikiensis]